MTLAGIRCLVGWYLHKPQKFLTCVGPAWRCTECGTTGTTEGELLRIRDYVDPRRINFTRREDAA